MDEAFRADMAAGYTFDEPTIVLGSPMKDGEVLADVRVAIPLSRVNRHGLIAGATGTGKTKTLQLLAGQLSAAGVPVFAVDVKGDLSGLGAPGDGTNPKVAQRSASLAWTFTPQAYPVEILSLTGARGAHVRASVSSFGPLLLAKVLDLNETQSSVLAMVFHYCDRESLPLLDLADLRTTLKFLGTDEAKPILEDLGGMSSATLGVILRSLVMLEQEGAADLFGEPEFDPDDLMRTTADGKGVVSLLEVADVMERPRLYSTFVLWLLAQLYESLPEEGDLPKPKLAFFFDEAHLLFADASDALMEQIERTARLIRSKGVGVWFVTQAPTDVPSSVLGQLGNRVQHALRAFTADDADDLRKSARTFPLTDHYDVERTLTTLGIGEALVTVLGPNGVPTPLAATRLVPPDSRMAPLSPAELDAVIAASPLAGRYAEALDPQSAHEIISARLAAAKAAATAAADAEASAKASEEQLRKVWPEAAEGSAPASTGYGGMTPAQEKREIARRAKELETQRRERRAQEREAAALEKERQKTYREVARTVGRAVDGDLGEAVLRGLFGSLTRGRRL